MEEDKHRPNGQAYRPKVHTHIFNTTFIHQYHCPVQQPAKLIIFAWNVKGCIGRLYLAALHFNIPPSRLYISLNPYVSSRCMAMTLRIPFSQYMTIGCSEFNS